MASRQLVLILALASASALKAQTPAQTPARLRLSFGDAVRQASGTLQDTPAPATVLIAGFRTDEARSRVTQTRSGLLPTISLAGSWANRTLNPKALGFSFPGVPNLIGPFDVVDGRVQLQQTLFDFSNLKRVSAAKSQVTAVTAEGSATVELSAQTVAPRVCARDAGAGRARARQADSSLAAELVKLAVAQQQAASASIDDPRAGSAVGIRGPLDSRPKPARACEDRSRARAGARCHNPDRAHRTLSAELGTAAVPADRDAAVAQAIAARPIWPLSCAGQRRAHGSVGDLGGTPAAARIGGRLWAQRQPGVGCGQHARVERPGDAPGAGRLASRRAARGATRGGAGVRRTGERSAPAGSRRRRRGAGRPAVGRRAANDFGRAAGARRREVSQARQRFQAGVAGNIE
jgi:hypothetical protein